MNKFPNKNFLANHDLYYWGRGEYGVFGDGSNKDQKLPQVNDFIQRLKKYENLTFKQIKSCASQTLGLASKTSLFSSNSSVYRRWNSLGLGFE